MNHILLVEETQHGEHFDRKLADVRDGSGAADVALVEVVVEGDGAQAVEHQAVVRPVQKLRL